MQKDNTSIDSDVIFELYYLFLELHNFWVEQFYDKSILFNDELNSNNLTYYLKKISGTWQQKPDSLSWIKLVVVAPS